MSDARPSSIRTLLAAMGLAAAAATPGCIGVGNSAPPPFDAGTEEDAAAPTEDGGPDENDGGAPADDAG